MPNIWISSPNPTATPPIGNVDMGGMLMNAAGGWSRPSGTSAAAHVYAMIIDDAATPPARPPAALPPADVPNAAGNGGTWSYPTGIPGAPPGDHYKLAVWLDVEDCGCFFLAVPIVFLAQDTYVPPPAVPAPGPVV